MRVTSQSSFWCLLALALHLGLAPRAVAADSGGAPPAAEFKLEPYRKSIALRASIAGREGLFAFDTAGGLSLLTPQFAEAIGCRPWGRLTGFQMMGDKIQSPQCTGLAVSIAGLRLDMPTAAVFDVMTLFPPDAAPLAGSLALDIFAGKAITIDFPGRRLIVESSESLRARTDKATEFPARISREMQGRALAVAIGVPSAQGLVWMELDSGNGGTVLVSKPYAALLGLDPEKTTPQPADFALGHGFRVAVPAAFTPEMIIDGNIGMPFLKDLVVTLDLASGRLWLSR
jgi:hypothetical protein